MITYETEGIENFEKDIEKVEEFFNTQVKAMDVIEQPEMATWVNIGFSLINHYIQIEKDNRYLLNEIKNKLDTLEMNNRNLKDEVEMIKEEIEKMEKRA